MQTRPGQRTSHTVLRKLALRMHSTSVPGRVEGAYGEEEESREGEGEVQEGGGEVNAKQQ